MASVEEPGAAEASMRDLLDRDGLSEANEVEYREFDILLLWHEPKVAVVIEVSPAPDAPF